MHLYSYRSKYVAGELDMNECRELMLYLRPNIKRNDLLKAMDYMRRRCSTRAKRTAGRGALGDAVCSMQLVWQ